MERALIVPAGGIGTRLGLGVPKLLAPLNGRPMIEHLVELYSASVEALAVVVHPSALEATRELMAQVRLATELFVQERPTGMLDAILLAKPAVERWRPRRVWITWCDQVAIHPTTVARLKKASELDPSLVLSMPTCRSKEPYIHLVRNDRAEIVDVLHQREGDSMPETGEGDAGLFDLSLYAYLDLLPRYAAAPAVGRGTGERNFLPFVAAVRQHGPVHTFPCEDDVEAVGVNTPAELARVEAYLRARAAAGQR